MEEDSIDYLNEPEDDDEDPKEDPEEDHTDYPADGEDGDHEPSNDDDDDDDTNDKDKEPTEDKDYDEEEEAFETDESAPMPRSPQTKVSFSQTHLRKTRKTIRLEPPMSASMKARITEHTATPTPPPPGHHGERISVRPQTPMMASTQARIGAFIAGSPPFPLPPTSLAYDQGPLGHRAAIIRMKDDIPKEDMPPRRRFISTAPLPGCDVVESYVAAVRPLKGQCDFINTVEVGQGLIRSPVYDAWTIVRAANRAENVGYVRSLQASKHRMMAFTEEVNLKVSYQAHVRRQEKLHEVRHAYLSFEARNRALLARLETLETHLSIMKWQCQSAKDLVVRQMMRIHVLEELKALLACLNALKRWNKYSTLVVVPLIIKDSQEEADEQILSKRPKTLDDAIELANDLMDQKLRTYAERWNENKRKADDSSRNNQQQPPHKKQNVARAYTVGPSEKKAYTGNLPMCTKCNYHHIRQCAPKCGNYKRYGYTTSNCRVKTNNSNSNQNAGACYECGNTRHIKKNCPKLKNHGNGNEDGIAQGRGYALGGRDASSNSNVIMGTYLLNNRYASILFDTGVDWIFVSTTFSALIDIPPLH
uniref:CCHC-type domain-containing protein n=1 Tax=Tanacetum cinerariifolium TaxID=118510 RepID=A0A6L2J0V3_TANCI|nr:hypothetical protein [Tanacetum cinerariifolium]